MEHSENKISEFDIRLKQPSTEMLKAALPYFEGHSQKYFSILIKALELTSTVKYFDHCDDGDLEICSVNSEKKTPLNMLHDIRPYADSSMRETIDLMSNLIQAFSIYRSYRNNVSENPEKQPDTMEILKPFLSKEQQSVLNNYKAIFQGGIA